MIRNCLRKSIPLLVLFIISYFYTIPYYSSGFFPTHDGEWSIIRLAEMKREITDLQFPPRWSDYLNHGYGYPLFSFTYPFPYYLAGMISFMGIGLTDSIKIIFVISVFLSALFMYLLGKELGGEWAAFLASIFYITARYRLVNLYVRGSLGESLSFALFPLLFYLTLLFIKNKKGSHFSLLAICVGILILTHNVMSLLFFPLLLIFTSIISAQYKRKSLRNYLPYLVGLGLASFFFIPAILEKKYLILSKISLSDLNSNFIKITEFIRAEWSYGQRPSFSLGIGFVIIISLSVIKVLIVKTDIKFNKVLKVLLITLLFYLFFTTASSAIFWKIPPLDWIDFPWRLLGPITFLISLLVIFISNNLIFRSILILSSVMTIFINYQYAVPYDYLNYPDSYYQTNDATTTSMDELMPTWVTQKARNRFAVKVLSKSGKAEIKNITYNSKRINFDFKSSEIDKAIINTIYFPGWTFWLDGKKVATEISQPLGIISIDIGMGTHKVQGKFSETPIRWIADLISILSILYLIKLRVSHLL